MRKTFSLITILSFFILFIDVSLSARPAYDPVLRFREDWYGFKDHANFFDRIKYKPYTHCFWASYGGHTRLRTESWHHFNFKPKDSSDTYLLTRLFLHGDFHCGDCFRLFFERKFALSTDRDLPGGRRAADVDVFDFQNLFLDINYSKFTLRGGRQEMLFGKQRLVSPLNWGNTRRTFDGAWAIFSGEKWDITGFWSKPVRIKKYNFNDTHNQGEFFGIYATTDHLDLYWLGRLDDNATFNTKTGDERRLTVGARIWGDLCDETFTYEIEGAYQYGNLDSLDIKAYMVAFEGTYTCKNFCTEPILGVGFDYASGDDINDTSSLKTFNQLFPLGHAYLGYIDVIGRQNIFDYHSWLTLHPCERMITTLHVHYFRRASSNDALYNSGGGVVFPAAAGDSKKVGTEIDFTCKYDINRHMKALFGYSHFFKGRFVKQALSGSKHIDFLYLSLLFVF